MSEKVTEKDSRPQVEFKPRYQRFIIGSKKSFEVQYSHLYQKRLRQMRENVKRSVRSKFGRFLYLIFFQTNKNTSNTHTGTDIAITNTIVRASLNRKTQILIGTLYKEMKGKPNILNELEQAAKFTYDKDGNELEKEASDVYAGEDDTFVLEDESGRIELICSNNSFNVHDFVTGTVIALKGKVTQDGSFDVEATCGPTYERKSKKEGEEMDTDEDAYVLMVSGLNVGSSENIHLPQVLADYVTGHLGDVKEITSKIARVLVVGNSVEKKETSEKETKTTTASRLRGVQPLEQLDLVLSQIVSSVPVDLIPGESDPTNFILPQQPFHPCLFPESARYTSFRSTTNPYHSDINKVSFLGTLICSRISNLITFTNHTTHSNTQVRPDKTYTTSCDAHFVRAM